MRFWMDDPPGGISIPLDEGQEAPTDSFDPVKGADIAEAYLHDPPHALLPGTLMSNSTTTALHVRRSIGRYDKDIMGAVTESPHLVMGDEASTTVRIGMVGRIRTIVSLENGPISLGSRITSSSLPGVGMRAGRPGSVVGRALEDFDPEHGKGTCDQELKTELLLSGIPLGNDSCVARVMVLLKPGFDMSIGDIIRDVDVVALELGTALEELAHAAVAQGTELTKVVVEKIVAQSAIIGNLFAKEVHTKKLCVGDTCVSEEQFLALVTASQGGGSESQEQGPQEEGSVEHEDLPPSITIVGPNPLTVPLGSVFADPGSTATDDSGYIPTIRTFFQGEEVEQVVLDTYTPGSHTITYQAEDNAGNTSKTERVVIVGDSVENLHSPEQEQAPEQEQGGVSGEGGEENTEGEDPDLGEVLPQEHVAEPLESPSVEEGEGEILQGG
jgi:hypothetical protein